jgi:hypothetical protein
MVGGEGYLHRTTFHTTYYLLPTIYQPQGVGVSLFTAEAV